MTHRYADLTFTESVKAAQASYGSRENNARRQENFGPNDQLTSKETDFIALRDTFYLATVGETDWPYVQHRGGPRGFLKVLSPSQIAYADFRGNTQFISVGNVSSNDRCSLLLMDYPNRRRLKILGHMRVEDANSVSPETLAQVQPSNYRALIERVVLIQVAAFDWNCPQHITRRYTELEFTEQQDKQSNAAMEQNRADAR